MTLVLQVLVESLVEELAAGGLILKLPQTKTLTTENVKEPMFLVVGGDMIEVLHEGQNQKYFGKQLSGERWWTYNIGVRSLG